ncbi:hypothetical protein Pmani_025262 [Petrolisthes manimaculis]|uniref:Aminopeptidase n=1 Tax=Petrolisthes manimaculis TaxID=1843537 RepID=A0AAE1P8B1_9EUCA|nr:hypothetical protein Pmani_025262 [Petrolisthes manimaculis]
MLSCSQYFFPSSPQQKVRQTGYPRRRCNGTLRRQSGKKGTGKTTNTSPFTTTTTTTTITTTTTPSEEEISVRLPLSLKPLHYLVKLQPLINGNFSILGYVEVEVEVLEATTNFTLHIADIITNNNTVKATSVRPRPSVLHRPPGGAATGGYKVVLSMQFEGHLNDQLHGFYRSTYRDADGEEKRQMPDEPSLAWTNRVSRPPSKCSWPSHQHDHHLQHAIKETIPLEGEEGWVWDHYDTTVPMSTYLVAFVVSDFANLTTTANNKTLFRVWARESAIQQAEYAREVGPPILSHFEEYFNQSYPLPKQDMVAIPDFSAGAMENWGLITYRETAMLYDPDVSAASNKQYVAAVVAHELAHQWFGNLVTPRWWTDLWLNEGFASYVEYIGINHVEPTWQVMQQFVLNEVQVVFSLDSLESSHPISIPVGHPDEISQIFDRISYAKGASIIRMMNHFLTESTFRRGLSDYLDAFQYGNAEQDDLWEYLTQAGYRDDVLPTNLTVKTIMDTWTLQMGYPVITVQRNETDTSTVISQERFLLTRQENSEDTHDYKWWVPLTYTDQAEADFSQTQPKVWMKDSEAQITIPHLATKDHWVIFNLHQTGYYRVNYDLHNWHLLTSQLLSQHTAIATINRAQIIDDAMNLARAGHLSYDIALGLYSYLGAETEYVPWASSLNNLSYLKDMFTHTGSYGGLRRYLVKLVLPLYRSVGFKEREGDTLLHQYKRQKALWWACRLGLMDCLENAVAAFNTWREAPDNNTLISANLKSTVYCHAIAEGGEEEWNFAWHQYLEGNVASEKNRLLSAMGCTKHIWILSRYLEMAFSESSGIRKQDAFRVFGAVASNELRLFRRERGGDLGSASRAVQQVIERTKVNIAWMDTNYDLIVHWLNTNGYTTTLTNK